MIDVGPPVGTLVRLRPCCGPGGVHEGHEDRCRLMPAGRVMSSTDYPHEHDHPRVEKHLHDGAWEVLEQDIGFGVFVRRVGDRATGLVDPEAVVELLEPEAWQRLLRTAGDYATMRVEAKWLIGRSGHDVAVAVFEAVRRELERSGGSKAEDVVIQVLDCLVGWCGEKDAL